MFGELRRDPWWTAWLFAIVLSAIGPTTHAQPANPELWVCDPGSSISSMTLSGDRLYLGGSFWSFGPPSGGAVPVDVDRGLPTGAYPKVAGLVYAAIPDGAGGWFIGGTFGGVGDLPRQNLAHILADGAVAPWAPEPDGTVRSIALSGDILYVAGDFANIGDQSRHGLAAVDVYLGRATDWAPEPVWHPIFAPVEGPGFADEVLTHGNTVYVGGRFTEVGGAQRHGLAALDNIRGRATAWDPQCDSYVRALALHKEILYVGGDFWHIGGRPQRYLAAVDLTADTVTSWAPVVDRVPEYTRDEGPGVFSIAPTDSTVFIAGKFNRVGGLKRVSLAAIDANTGAATEWDARVNGEYDLVPGPILESVLVRGSAVYVGGVFFAGLGGRPATTYIGGEFAGALDIRTGRALDWNPKPNGQVLVLAESGGRIYIGGSFTSVRDWVQQPYLAALDLNSGALTSWNPSLFSGQIRSLVAYGGKVYVAGGFGTIGGQPRANIAALDPVTGMATAWNPSASGLIWTLAAAHGRIYAGGLFNTIGGQPRRNIAALDTTTGAVAEWNPGADDLVTSFAFAGNNVYVGGGFSTIGGQLHSAVAAIDRETGAAIDWGPGRFDSSSVNSLAILDTTLYLGGSFTHATIGGQPRTLMAAVDLRTGAVRPWDAHFSPVNATSDGFSGIAASVRFVAAGDGVVYAAGGFSRVGGSRRNFLAALNPVTGDLLDWDPLADRPIRVLEPRPNDVLIVGDFYSVGTHAGSGVAATTPARATRPPGVGPAGELSFTLHPAAPNPAVAGTVLSYELFTAGAVDLEVLDVAGRRMREVYKHSAQQAGPHQVALNTTSWPPGCYFYVVRVGGSTKSRKVLVTK